MIDLTNIREQYPTFLSWHLPYLQLRKHRILLLYMSAANAAITSTTTMTPTTTIQTNRKIYKKLISIRQHVKPITNYLYKDGLVINWYLCENWYWEIQIGKFSSYILKMSEENLFLCGSLASDIHMGGIKHQAMLIPIHVWCTRPTN